MSSVLSLADGSAVGITDDVAQAKVKLDQAASGDFIKFTDIANNDFIVNRVFIMLVTPPAPPSATPTTGAVWSLP